MKAAPESVVYILPDKMGGMLNIVANLLAYREPDAFSYHAVLTHNHLSDDTRFAQRMAADTQQTVEYRLPVENIHAVIDRLHRALPPGGGVMVTNDLIELAMASAIDLRRTVMMILHGDYDYYYDLATRHEDVIDVFICYGRTIFNTLRARLPRRADSVVFLPYGIPLPSRVRSAAGGPLRLLYAGRIEQGAKGVFDLPQIDAAVRAAGVPVTWTIIGSGPDEQALRAQWADAPHVRWLGTLTNAQVLDASADHDAFILPTRVEGFSVALVESLAVGLVSVVSDIPSVREIIQPGVNGFTPPVGDIAGFADAIVTLARDRGRLEAMSAASRAGAVRNYDARERTRDYQRLFARHHELRRPRPAGARMPYGSRLDRPWVPNAAVKAVRRVVRRAKGKPV